MLHNHELTLTLPLPLLLQRAMQHDLPGLSLELDLLRSWACSSSPLLSHLIVGHALTLHLFMVLLMSLIFITLTLD